MSTGTRGHSRVNTLSYPLHRNIFAHLRYTGFSGDKLKTHIQIMNQVLLALVQQEPNVTAGFRVVTETVNSIFTFYDQSFAHDPNIFTKQEKAQRIEFELLKLEHATSLSTWRSSCMQPGASLRLLRRRLRRSMETMSDWLESSFDK